MFSDLNELIKTVEFHMNFTGGKNNKITTTK